MSSLPTLSTRPSPDNASTSLEATPKHALRGLPGLAIDRKYILRVLLALGVLAVWMLQAQPYSLRYWTASASTPSAPGDSDLERSAFLEGEGAVVARVIERDGTPQQGGNLYKMLSRAQTSCPSDRPVLAVGDYLIIGQSAYVLYPRQVEVKTIADLVAHPDISNWAGGCLLYFGRQDAWEHIGPLLPGLTQLTCNDDGCLYTIAP